MTRTVLACPYCDRSCVQTNNVASLHSPNPDADAYRCKVCDRTFEEPVEREARREVALRPGSLAARLDAAHPDEVSR